MGKSLLVRIIILSSLLGIIVSVPQMVSAGSDSNLKFCRVIKDSYEVAKTAKIVVTAHSSSWDETTGIPGKPGLITASGKRVADGIVAYNHLSFGTKIRINVPGFEDKIFVVEDRTAAGRKNLDIWMPSKQEALNFGAKVVEIEILES